MQATRALKRVHQFGEDLFDLPDLRWLSTKDHDVSSDGDRRIKLILDQPQMLLVRSQQFYQIDVSDLDFLFYDVHGFLENTTRANHTVIGPCLKVGNFTSGLL
jgi:hypothetical protein